ncbi:integrin alpha-L isoform X2 [Silurus meridionalis]|nr:integrin alpha-L isoform X2 [Silurus meridionalis]
MLQLEFAVVQYSSQVRTVFTFKDYVNGMAKKKLDEEQHMKALTNTHKAIKYVSEKLFNNVESGADPEATKALVIITDGSPSDLSRNEIQRCDELNIARFVIGVGTQVKIEKLKGIASEPKEQNTFMIGNYNGLDGLLEKLQNKIYGIKGAQGRNFINELSQSGFSAASDKDTLILGAVGSNDWCGALYEVTGSESGTNKAKISESSMSASYDGYSVAVGRRDNVSLVFSGAPRSNHRDTSPNICFQYSQIHLQTSAPSTARYIYKHLPPVQTGRTPNIYSQYSQVELQTSAPSTVRYITKHLLLVQPGRTPNICSQYSQVHLQTSAPSTARYISKHLPPVHTGTSSNICPSTDRTRPVVSVSANFSFSPSEINLNHFECTDQDSVIPIITLKTCFSMKENTNSKGAVKSGLNVSVELRADAVRQESRAFFIMEDKDSRSLVKSVLLNSEFSCFNNTVYMQISDHQSHVCFLVLILSSNLDSSAILLTFVMQCINNNINPTGNNAVTAMLTTSSVPHHSGQDLMVQPTTRSSNIDETAYLQNFLQRLKWQPPKRSSSFTPIWQPPLQRPLMRPTLPSIGMGNVRSLPNRMDKLAALTWHQREFWECNVMLFMQSLLTKLTPDITMALDGFIPLRADRTMEISKRKGGGLAVFVNNRCCKPGHITIKEQICCKDIELLAASMRSYYLPRKFLHVIAIAAYIYPSVDGESACDILHSAVNRLLTQSPNALLIISVGFNHATPTSTLPTFTQYVSCHTRDNKTLDLFYASSKEAYTSATPPWKDRITTWIISYLCTNPLYAGNQLPPADPHSNHYILPLTKAQRCVKDTLSPVLFRLNFHQSEHQPGDSSSILNIDSSNTTHVEVPFQINCKNRSCVSDLQLDFSFL